MIEFALVLPLLILIGVGILDLGRAYFTVIAVTNGSREGARYLVMHPDDKDLAFAGTKNAAVREANNSFITISLGDVIVNCPGPVESCGRGQPVTVTVRHDFNLILSLIYSGTLPLERTTQMRVP